MSYAYTLLGDTMTKIDNFKSFVKNNPNLISYIRNGQMSWQKFYELYDIYGEDENVWREYKKEDIRKEIKTSKTTSNFNFSNIIEMTKNLDTNKIQDGITSIQKALSLFGDMLIKDKGETNTYTPRPIYRRFDD